MLRLARHTDAPALAAIYAPSVRGSAVSFEEHPPTASEMAARVAATVPRWPWLVAEVDGACVAYAYAGPHRVRAAYRWAVEVSVYAAPGHHRRGLGRRLYGTLLPLLRDQGYRRAFAGATLPNPASAGLHEAMGFAAIGVYPDVGYKNGRWHDVGWWSLALAPPVPDPPPPVPLDDALLARHGLPPAELSSRP